MDLNLHDKVAVVTGGSKGIGLAIAIQLADEGALPVIGARTVTDELAQACEKYPITTVQIDLATAGGAGELADVATETHGGIDILINNVGTSELGPTFLAIDDESWQYIFDITFFSAVRMSRAAIPSMIERGGGTIVNIGSMNAKVPDSTVPHYSAAKAALANLNKSLAVELAPHKIRVNAISPGPVRTPFWTGVDGFAHVHARAAGISPEEAVERMLPKNLGILTGRFSKADEVAALATFLASDVAGNITGADYALDGGAVRSL